MQSIHILFGFIRGEMNFTLDHWLIVLEKGLTVQEFSFISIIGFCHSHSEE